MKTLTIYFTFIFRHFTHFKLNSKQGLREISEYLPEENSLSYVKRVSIHGVNLP